MKFMKGLKIALMSAIPILFSLGFSLNAYAWPGQPGGVYSYTFGNPQIYPNDNIVWTTEPGDKSIDWCVYNAGLKNYSVVPSGIGTNLRPVDTGEHAYTGAIHDKVYIGKWIYDTNGVCAHFGSDWMGVIDYHDVCMNAYQNRWIGYCADCGKPIGLLITGSEYLMKNLNGIPNESRYYYLCPIENWSNARNGHMEQGAGFGHRCKGISANRYSVRYNINNPSGSTIKNGDTHTDKGAYYYNNATKYESKNISPKINLMTGDDLGWKVQGYKFTGFYTEPQGGVKVTTWMELQNTLSLDVINKNESIIDVYAHWEEWDINLVLKDESAPSDKTYKIGLWEEFKVPNGVGDNYVVSLNANGGTCTATLPVTKKFDYWITVPVFLGKYDSSSAIYTDTYKDVNHATTALKAVYYPAEVILPTPSRPGYEFLGWEDTYGNLVARSGDTLLVNDNTSLKARWNKLDLSLTSVENYQANNGFGAIDLSWLYSGQSDLTIFKAFRSEANNDDNYTVVKNSSSVAEETVIDKSFTTDATYIIPENGFYTIESYGAKGGDNGDYVGGKGGYVTAKVFLRKGQELTIEPSGIAGGTGSGSGGSAARVYIDGNLFQVAGGGGGAGLNSNGHPGGEMDLQFLTDTSEGQSSYVGGGSGYLGGLRGTYTLHTHGSSSGGAGTNKTYYYDGDTSSSSTRACYTRHQGTQPCPGHQVYVSGSYSYSVPRSNCPYGPDPHDHTTELYGWTDCYGSSHNGNEYYRWYCHASGGSGYGTTGRVYCGGKSYDYWALDNCPYDNTKNKDNFLIASEGAFGGSNYLDSSAVGTGSYFISGSYQNSTNKGINDGSGYVVVKSVSVGFQLDTKMNAVIAPDVDGPEKPVAEMTTEGTKVIVNVGLGKDVGTIYYFYVQSFNMNDSDTVTATSNKTYNKLTSGIKEIRYLVDTNASTVISSSNIDDCTTISTDGKISKAFNVTKTNVHQYAHVVYVDVAGNISETTTVDIGSIEIIVPDAHSHYALNKPVLSIENEDADNIYLDGDKLYVKADGISPLKLKETATIPAITDYFRINKLMFKENNNLNSNHIYIATDSAYNAEDAVLKSGKDTYLSAINLPLSEVSEDKLEVASTQSFTLNKEIIFDLIPRSEATCLVHNDATNYAEGDGYKVYGDNTAPEITITSALDYELGTYLDLGEIPEYKFALPTTGASIKISASDSISGLRHVKTYLGAEGDNPVSSTNGYTFVATKNGIYELIVVATDNVGNEEKVRVTIGVDLTAPQITDFTLPVDNNPDNDDYIPKVAKYGEGTSVYPYTGGESTSIEHDTYYYTYGWVNHDILLKYAVADSSKISSIVLYKGWSESEVAQIGIIDSDTSGRINYNVNVEGIDKYLLVCKDKFRHEKKIYITTKIDYTAPQITGLEKIGKKDDSDTEGLVGLNMTNYGLGEDEDVPIIVTVKANDQLVERNGSFVQTSGLDEFTLIFNNTDNNLTRIYSTDSSKAFTNEPGHMASEFVITKENPWSDLTPDVGDYSVAKTTITLYEGDGAEIEDIFKGRWTIQVVAKDHVKNESDIDTEFGFFKLKAKFLQRNGSDNRVDGNLVIKNGDACILKIETEGYVDLLKVNLDDFNKEGYTIYKAQDMNEFWNSNPAENHIYNKNRVAKVEKSYDYVSPDKSSSRYTIYYMLISPFNPEHVPDDGVYKAIITAFKGVSYVQNPDGSVTVNVDESQINNIIVNEEAKSGSNEVALSVKTGVKTSGSVVDGLKTTIELVK